jgi:glycosyltransferase involved in cell wall biosynthesis
VNRPALLWGLILLAAGFAIQLSGTLVAFVIATYSIREAMEWSWRVVFPVGLLTLAGLCLIFVELFLLLPRKRVDHWVKYDPPANRELTVALTAYNDEASIGKAVADFTSHPLVKRVLVVDNNSTDETTREAVAAGALLVREERQGYGHCVHRALSEACKFEDTELLVLCEGDLTFRAMDIDKLMSYIPHAEIVNGTRIVEQLRSWHTQLTTFMFYGNFAVGKLLEVKHIGQGTFTDVGTTYKLCRTAAVRKLLPHLNPAVNLEFNAHFLDRALDHLVPIVECPITFYERVGVSKGGNASNYRALMVGLRMIRGILFGWKKA